MSHTVLPAIGTGAAQGINGIGNLSMVTCDVSGAIISSDLQSAAQQSMNSLYFLSASMFSPTGSLTINNAAVTVNSSEQVTFNADVVFADGFVVDDSVLFNQGVTITGSVPTLIENATTCSLGLAVTGQALTVGSVGVVTEGSGRFYTADSAQIGGDLTVNGSQTVINGTLDANSTAHVLGGLTTDTLSVTSQVDVTGSLSTTGNAVVGGTLFAGGETTLNSGLITNLIVGPGSSIPALLQGFQGQVNTTPTTSVAATDTVLINSAGSGTITFPSSVSAGQIWFVVVLAGGGSVVIAPPSGGQFVGHSTNATIVLGAYTPNTNGLAIVVSLGSNKFIAWQYGAT